MEQISVSVKKEGKNLAFIENVGQNLVNNSPQRMTHLEWRKTFLQKRALFMLVEAFNRHLLPFF